MAGTAGGPSPDTSWLALKQQIEAYRRMTPAARVEMMLRMSEEIREIALSGIRQRHPDYDEAQARLALYRLLYGAELVREAWPMETATDP
jgi:hypothetical protein